MMRRMRPTMRAESPAEFVALRFNLAPLVVGEAMFGMPTARSVIAGVRLGVFERLAKEPASADELAAELGLHPQGTLLLLETLGALGHVQSADGRYELSKADRRWLDPASDTYVGDFIDDCGAFWDMWTQLEEIVRTGKSLELHDMPPDDPAWRRYIRGQFELARLSAPEVAKALRLPREPRALLDVAGGHGWFSAELCRRHPSLKATIVDLPGSAAVGREIIAEHGMSERVEHRVGDAFEVELGGPYDGALCFNLIHHLSPAQNVELFKRIHAALAPGAPFAVLDLFRPKEGGRADASAMLGLFFYLTSAAGTYSPEELAGWLHEAGFEKPRKVKIRRIPGQTLYEARKRG
jgi:2-polyprenyl-3-methyl-5-hydroxy-6-metoxy-1,4-benzoquinol methylase